MGKPVLISHRFISFILIASNIFMLTGCYTTNAIYGEEIETAYSLVNADITSTHNKAGLLYYTIDPIYQNTKTGKLLKDEMRNTEYYKLINHNPDFPFSTYSDVVYYRDNVLPKEIIYKSRDIIETQREFSPVKTGLAIGLPALGLITLIISMLLNPPETSNNKK